jgi:hypothetical protein
MRHSRIRGSPDERFGLRSACRTARPEPGLSKATSSPKMHLVGQLSNPSAALVAVFEALPDEPIKGSVPPEPQLDVGRLGKEWCSGPSSGCWHRLSIR